MSAEVATIPDVGDSKVPATFHNPTRPDEWRDINWQALSAAFQMHYRPIGPAESMYDYQHQAAIETPWTRDGFAAQVAMTARQIEGVMLRRPDCECDGYPGAMCGCGQRKDQQ